MKTVREPTSRHGSISFFVSAICEARINNRYQESYTMRVTGDHGLLTRTHAWAASGAGQCVAADTPPLLRCRQREDEQPGHGAAQRPTCAVWNRRMEGRL
jgi:hypothetical protein